MAYDSARDIPEDDGYVMEDEPMNINCRCSEGGADDVEADDTISTELFSLCTEEGEQKCVEHPLL